MDFRVSVFFYFYSTSAIAIALDVVGIQVSHEAVGDRSAHIRFRVKVVGKVKMVALLLVLLLSPAQPQTRVAFASASILARKLVQDPARPARLRARHPVQAGGRAAAGSVTSPRRPPHPECYYRPSQSVAIGSRSRTAGGTSCCAHTRASAR